MAGPFKLRSGNKSPLAFKQMGSSPVKYEKKPVGPVANAPDAKKEFIKKHVSPYSPPPSKPKPPETTKLRLEGHPKKTLVTKPKSPSPPPKGVTKGDVLQTVIAPQVNIKKTVKVVKHYGEKVSKKVKSLYGKAKKYLASDA